MPQMNRGGKFIFGRSLVREDGTVRLPDQAVREYAAASEGRVYLFTGSRSTGGFCVTRRGLLGPSRLGHILSDLPDLGAYRTEPGGFSRYKGRAYCWADISPEGRLVLTPGMLDLLRLEPGMELLSIRSSDIAFTMGAKGPLVERSEAYAGEIPVF